MTTATAPEQFLSDAQALACIHCGLCLGSCPTYLETGNENDSPRGRIYLMRALQSGRLPIGNDSVRHIDLCLGCRACEAACPSGVQYGALLEATRDHIEPRYRRSAFQTLLRRVFIERVFPNPILMRAALAPARMIKAFHLEKLLPKFMRDAFDLIPEKISAQPLPELSRSVAKTTGRVGFIRGCVMSVMFGETNLHSVQLLNREGFDVATPSAQGCCGALFAHSGNLAKARECARVNIAAFEQAGVNQIIINAAGCGSTLKDYGHLLENDSAWHERAKVFSAKVRDLSEVLTPSADAVVREKVTFHDACHLAHAQRITKHPRDVVRARCQDFVEMPESDVCCGSAGSYNLTEPEMAERLQNRKIENILKSGAQIIVTTNPGCLLQIQAGLRKAGAPKVRVIHLADFLVECDGLAEAPRK